MSCPDCPAAQAARSLVMADLAANAWRAVLPFVLIALIIAIVIRRVQRHDG